MEIFHVSSTLNSIKLKDLKQSSTPSMQNIVNYILTLTHIFLI